MSHILRSEKVEIHIDFPMEGYRFSRFDWTGKITKVRFYDVPVTTLERKDDVDSDIYGKGLYNEFGIETAIGYDETDTGDWFHKIGVGALKKTEGPYQFTNPYQIRPAIFHVEPQPDKLRISCVSDKLNGYAYILTKEFEIKGNSLIINYQLENTGQKDIITDEYVHNFMGVDNDDIGKEYELRFPFKLEPQEFQTTVNPEEAMKLEKEAISFASTPKEQFFVSHLNGSLRVKAGWELLHKKSRMGVRETGNFTTKKVNLWGWQHVVSPELFHNIHIKPGHREQWIRTYEVFELQ